LLPEPEPWHSVAGWHDHRGGPRCSGEDVSSWNESSGAHRSISSPAGLRDRGCETVNDDPGRDLTGPVLRAAQAFDIEGVKERLAEAGGYEIVHSSPGLEIGVYVLVAPEPDRQQPHGDDEIYLVLEGTGLLDVEGEKVDLREGHALFVPAGAKHRFSAYERLSLLVIFERVPAHKP
jgi:mannose-6-phosphate isomerase-like protein (cupin superfamily)